MSKTKIIAMYLPQYHCIPENDEFWGKGFTDWVTVKKAKPLFEGHQQPRVPLNENYYDLSRKEDVAWQCKLAKEHGIYGFGIYHYWFNNEKNLLTKPAEIIRDNKDIDMNYFFAWDNISWRRTWSNLSGNSWAPTQESKKKNGPSTLIEYILGGEEDWKNHYGYVRTHFKDLRYIKIGNKPVFIIFYNNEEIAKMCEYWDKLAKEDGFDGMYFIFRHGKNKNYFNPAATSELIFNYEPITAGWGGLAQRIISRLQRKWGITPGLKIYSYDKVWGKLLKDAIGKHSNKNIYHGAFVDYDDSPRRGYSRGIVVLGSTPEKFKHYMSQLMKISEDQGKSFIFLTAWNEWGEGACLEPNVITRMGYLEVVKELTKQ